MAFLNTIVRTLGKPFPEESWSSYIKKLIVLSLFVAFFLYVFKPFGLDTLESDRLLICLGFGSMTLVGALTYELSIGQLLRLMGYHKNWIFGKWIVNTLATTLFISLANFIFARLILIGYIDWALFPTMLYSTVMIGILPVTILGAWLLSQQEKKYQSIASEIGQVNLSPTQSSNAGISVFDIPIPQIKYIEALQNYVKIAYLNDQRELKIQTERLTLKEVIAKTEGSSLTKCHRSFVVNKETIMSVSGNAQGLLLSLTNCDKTIPVSRSFVPQFRNN